MNKIIFTFFCNNPKALSHLELIFNKDIIMDARYKNWWISRRWYPRIFPMFIWEIFGHVIVLDQSRANKNIWLIIMVDINRAAKRWGNIHCQPPTLQWIVVLVYTETARRCSAKYDFNCYKILWRGDFQNAIDATTRTKIKSLLRPEALFNGRCKQMKIMHSLK